MGIASRILEGPGRKPRRRPGSDPEVETDSGNHSLKISNGLKKVSRRSMEGFREIPGRFPEGFQKDPGSDRVCHDQLMIWNIL